MLTGFPSRPFIPKMGRSRDGRHRRMVLVSSGDEWGFPGKKTPSAKVEKGLCPGIDRPLGPGPKDLGLEWDFISPLAIGGEAGSVAD